jgi:exodeoxyribonuclease VII small subunit
MAATDGASPNFDQLLDRLRQVVERLEKGDLTLEDSLAAFEEGVKLARRGAEILDGAERRVEILLKGEDGELRTEPFKTSDE